MSGHLITVFIYLQIRTGTEMEMEMDFFPLKCQDGLFSVIVGQRARSNGFKFQQENFKLEIRRTLKN